MKRRCGECFAVFDRDFAKCPMCGTVLAVKEAEPLLGSEPPLPNPPAPPDAVVEPPANVTPLQLLEDQFRTLAMQVLGMCGQIEKISEVIELLKKEQADGRPATQPQLPTESTPRHTASVAEPQGGGAASASVARNT